MAIHDFDGYDDYVTALLLREHVRVESSTYVAIVSGGRNSGNRLECKCYDSGGTIYSGRVVRAVTPTVATTLAWGAYLSLSNLTEQTYLFDVRDAVTSHLLVLVATDGSIGVYRSSKLGDWGNRSDYNNEIGFSATELGRTVAGVVSAGVPFHFQAKVLVSDTVGTVEVRVNGVTVLTLTGQDTRNGSTATITNLLYGVARPGVLASGAAGALNVTAYFDDLWLADDFVGDRRVDSHYPIEDGANQDGTPSSVGDHFALVDEASPDDDTSYVTLAAADDRESYGVEAFKNTGATIDAVMVVMDAKKTDAGSATLGAHIHSPGSPGTDYDGTAQGLTTDYARYKQVYETDPDSGSPGDPWDEAGFNAAEFGDLKVA